MYDAILATQNGYVATFCERNICATLRDPKQICCDIARPKKGMMLSLRLKTGMLRLCETEIFARLCPTKKNILLDFGSQFRVEVCNSCSDSLDPGSICFDRLESSCLIFDNVRPRKYISTKFDLRKTFRSSRCRRYRLPGHRWRIFHRNRQSELSPLKLIGKFKP